MLKCLNNWSFKFMSKLVYLRLFFPHPKQHIKSFVDPLKSFLTFSRTAIPASDWVMYQAANVMVSTSNNLITDWGRVTQTCVSKFTIIGSDNGLSPIRRQAIIWSNAGILLIWTLETNFSEILIQIHTFPNKKMHLKRSSGKCQPFCLGLIVNWLRLGDTYMRQ